MSLYSEHLLPALFISLQKMSVSVYLWQPTLVPRPCIWVLHVKVGQWYKDLQGVS